MISKYGKIFKNALNNKVECVLYDKEQDYYSFIQDMLSHSYHQCIVTSNIMIKIINDLLLTEKIEILSIEFMIEERELDEEIKTIIKKMKSNLLYWNVLKDKLSFLSQNDSIEIKSVNFKTFDVVGLFAIKANGIIIASENIFDDISKNISKIVGESIK